MAEILAVVGDEALARLLKDGLEETAQHRVRLARSAQDSLETIKRHAIELAIVDVDLEGVQPLELARAMRQVRPSLRIMWMPFLGEELNEEMLSLDTQGVLTKPFFMDDLPVKIAEALSKPQPRPQQPLPVSASLRTTAASAPADSGVAQPAVVQGAQQPPTPWASAPNLAQVKDILSRLAHDLDAEAVVIVDRQGNLLAQAGYLSGKNALELASILTDEIAATAKVAKFLKEKSGYFAHNIHEGDEHRLFSVVLSRDGIALSVITRADIPLGTVRFHVRQAVALLNSSLGATQG
jgi:CheY-like chemotaxis protein